MKLLLVSALCLLAASPAWSTCLGSITVKDYGEVFIVAPDWAAGAISIQNNGFTMRGNSRLYFASRCENSAIQWAAGERLPDHLRDPCFGAIGPQGILRRDGIL